MFLVSGSQTLLSGLFQDASFGPRLNLHTYISLVEVSRFKQRLVWIFSPMSIGPSHDPVTWYKITHAGEQVPQWDFQNKGSSRWTGTSGIVLEVPLSNLLTSMCDFVPCDRIVQRAYFLFSRVFAFLVSCALTMPT